MALSYYYRDGEEVNGPFEENVVLNKYRQANFTSDVQFQIRASDTDDKAPFTTLFNLISKNGHQNPFRNEKEDLDRLIAEKEKELEELAAILAKKELMEQRLSEIEKKIEDIKEKRSKELNAKKSDGGNTKTDPFTLSKQRHHEKDEMQPLPVCDKCELVFCSYKQLQMHFHRSSCRSTEKGESAADLERWKKEDEQRLAAGQRIFKTMKEEVNTARPQIEFVEELHSRISKKMVFEFGEDGKDIARVWIRSEEAKKMSDRVVKHLKEATGNLVCSRCKVACRSHAHFVIHLTTYDHRLKVKGTPLELISLLVGFYHKKEYLELPEPSELDEDLNLDEAPATPVIVPAEPARVVAEPEHEEFDAEKGAGLKKFLIDDWSRRGAMQCVTCGHLFSTYKQWLLHGSSEEHEEKSGGLQERANQFKEFDQELQKWRWEDKVKLTVGKRMFNSMSAGEKEAARPTEEFTQEMGKMLQEALSKLNDGQFDYFGYLTVGNYLTGEEGTQRMKELEEHLNQARKFVCRPCKAAFDERDKYYVHCQITKHLFNTHDLPEKYVSYLIGMHKKDLYFK